METLRHLWTRHRLLSLAFLVTAALAVGFAIRGAMFMPPFRQPPEDPAIEGWMTPRLVGHGWGLPPEVLAEALGIKLGEGRGRTLDDIAEAQGVTLAELAARIEAAAEAFRATRHPPGAPPPPRPPKTGGQGG